ncbi:unnamed protein product, partial [Larinioides sclopetarius]
KTWRKLRVCIAKQENDGYIVDLKTRSGNIFTAQEFLILIDGTVALQTTDFKLAMALLVLFFFVFNIEYPEKAG